jgi:hypothetical protein
LGSASEVERLLNNFLEFCIISSSDDFSPIIIWWKYLFHPVFWTPNCFISNSFRISLSATFWLTFQICYINSSSNIER